jgi:hypothetical protein
MPICPQRSIDMRNKGCGPSGGLPGRFGVSRRSPCPVCFHGGMSEQPPASVTEGLDRLRAALGVLSQQVRYIC